MAGPGEALDGTAPSAGGNEPSPAAVAARIKREGVVGQPGGSSTSSDA